MLRRKPTSITVTSEDVAAYEDMRLRADQVNDNSSGGEPPSAQKQTTVVDPSDELKPLPGEKARVVRTREERIGVGSRA
jgi:hypothetical protein